MKIAIIGASGKQGSLLLKEALARDHDVTAIVRNKDKIKNTVATVLEKDLFDLCYSDLKEFDAIIDAFGAWTPEESDLHATSLKHLTDILAGKPNRLLIVGGAGSLFTDAKHTTRLMDTPGFLDAWKPTAKAMAKGLDQLRQIKEVDWTYLSPSAEFNAEAPRTGDYRLGGEEALTNKAGKSAISYADYAIAMIDEAENGGHSRQRITAVSL